MGTWYRAFTSRMERVLPGLPVRCLPLLAVLAAVSGTPSLAAEPAGATEYQKKIEPILDRYCSGCHGGGSSKGEVAFDKPVSSLLEDRDLWWKTLKMLR